MTDTRAPVAGGGPVRVAIVDDHLLFLGALGDYLGREPGVEIVATASRWVDFLVHPAYPAEVVLLDLDLQDQLPAVIKIRALTAAGAAVVVVSSFARADIVLASLEAGARGYVPKRSELREVTKAIAAVSSGHSYVTPELAGIALQDRRPQRPVLSGREQEVLALYATGLPLKSVARRSGISYSTAVTYLDRIRVKYEEVGRPARTKIELRGVALEDGWVEDP